MNLNVQIVNYVTDPKSLTVSEEDDVKGTVALPTTTDKIVKNRRRDSTLKLNVLK